MFCLFSFFIHPLPSSSRLFPPSVHHCSAQSAQVQSMENHSGHIYWHCSTLLVRNNLQTSGHTGPWRGQTTRSGSCTTLSILKRDHSVFDSAVPVALLLDLALTLKLCNRAWQTDQTDRQTDRHCTLCAHWCVAVPSLQSVMSVTKIVLVFVRAVCCPIENVNVSTNIFMDQKWLWT